MTDTVNKQALVKQLERNSVTTDDETPFENGWSACANFFLNRIKSGQFDIPSTPVQGYREALIEKCADLNHYDDDQFTPPTCIDELLEADVAEVMDWVHDLLRACADNVYGVIEDDGMLADQALSQTDIQLSGVIKIRDYIQALDKIEHEQADDIDHSFVLGERAGIKFALECLGINSTEDDQPGPSISSTRLMLEDENDG